ncbi:hypothetical protein IWZ03DRAFT_372833 [Phyllosticta citriasiana]|uniref:Uncharacterized protein n=1 Tax=Phyllosticta citriasiana TaxID=595635 RepID=A0ABR1KSD8_9PEZI
MTLGRLLQDAGEEPREKTSQAVQEPVQERVERVQRATDKASQNVGQLTVEANDGRQQRAESTRKSLNDRAQRTSGEVDNVSQGRQRVEDDGDDLGNSVREVGEAVSLTSPELQANRVRDRSGNVADVEDEIRQENILDRVQGLRLAHRVVEDVRDQALDLGGRVSNVSSAGLDDLGSAGDDIALLNGCRVGGSGSSSGGGKSASKDAGKGKEGDERDLHGGG